MTPFCVGHKKAQKRRGCPLEADNPLLMREVICEKDHVLRFLMECRWKFVGEKCEHFFQLNVCIGFRVSSTFGQSDGCMSDTPETMGRLSGVPNGPSSQTSASRGYVLFDIKMAFMPSVVWCRKGHTRILKLSAGCGHDPRSAPNLERHGSSKMQTFGWLEMPHFLIRISSYIPSEIEKHDFLSYYFSQQKGQPVSCGSPFFFINSLNRLHALRRLKAKQIDAGLKHRLRQL